MKNEPFLLYFACFQPGRRVPFELKKKFLNFLTSYGAGEFCPTLYGQGEPIRHRFDRHQVEAALCTWQNAGLLLKRTQTPRYLVDISGFIDGKSVWLEVAIDFFHDLQTAKRFSEAIIDVLSPEFGYATSISDFRKRHWLTYEEDGAVVEEKVGLNLDHGLPGVYWLTFFGSATAEAMDINRFESLPTTWVTPTKNGYLVNPYNSPALPEDERRNLERSVIEMLGREYFFDRADLDRRSQSPFAELLVKLGSQKTDQENTGKLQTE